MNHRDCAVGVWVLAAVLLVAGCTKDAVQPTPPPPPPAQPNIAYYDGANKEAKLAVKNGPTWDIETIEGNDVGLFITLAFDASGVPHVAYKDFSTDGDVKYARKIAGNWQIETVDFSGDVGDWTSLALDSQGTPHIAYVDQSNRRIKYAFKSGVSWTTEIVDPTQSGFNVKIAVDAQGVPAVTYTDNGITMYAVRASLNNWNVEPASARRHGLESRLSLVIDNQGVPHIGFYTVTEGFFRVFKPAAVWLEESIDNNGVLAGQHASLIIDSRGRLRAAYGEFTLSQLWYGENDGQQWDLEVAVNNGNQVVGISLGLDRSGTPYVSYRDDLVDGTLKMAVRNSDGTWSFEDVDTTPNVGNFTSIVVR